MALKKPSGDMYQFINWVWNPVRGKCYHDCPYCYVKRIAKRFNTEQEIPHLVVSELNTNLGENNFIFVCSGCDLFAPYVPDEFIHAVINRTHDNEYRYSSNNKYLFQTKNPKRLTFSPFRLSADLHKICTTIESNYYRQKYMGFTPTPYERAEAMNAISEMGFETMVTIEPVMDFDLHPFLDLIKICKPFQVNIGADSGNNQLPEPPKGKVLELISELEKFTTVYQKKNLRRIVA